MVSCRRTPRILVLVAACLTASPAEVRTCAVHSPAPVGTQSARATPSNPSPSSPRRGWPSKTLVAGSVQERSLTAILSRRSPSLVLSDGQQRSGSLQQGRLLDLGQRHPEFTYLSRAQRRRHATGISSDVRGVTMQGPAKQPIVFNRSGVARIVGRVGTGSSQKPDAKSAAGTRTPTPVHTHLPKLMIFLRIPRPTPTEV